MDDQPLEGVMVVLFVESGATLRLRGIFLDPFPQLFPVAPFVGFDVVTRD